MMKKCISVLLAVCLSFAMVIPAFAADPAQAPYAVAAADIPDVAGSVGCEYPIIFVTGIGQTWTHLVNEDGSYKTDKNGEIIEYNLFYVEPAALLQPKALFATLRVLAQFIASAAFDHNFISQKDVEIVFSALMRHNIIDENGKLPADVEDCVKNYPLSEYNELDTKNFYRSIPCQAIVEEVGAENIFCFNHSAFDYLYDDADGLDKFIRETVLGKYSDAGQVVLVPMSMGAAVVNAYLDRYGAQNDVKRVVSIVGAWNGSDVVADMVERKYADNAPEMLYNGLMGELIGYPAGYIVNIALRIFPKRVLRGVIDTILAGVADVIILKTPSMAALIPSDRYLAIEQAYMQGSEYDAVRAQTHRYYEAQSRLHERLTALERQGMEFYFISGYGLTFGGGSGDYTFFQFMRSADTTNSDEIIQIASTAPGTTYAPYHQTLNTTGQYVSPDGTIDLSTSFDPERTWCFYLQQHELEYNNTALRLALDISTGKVKSVSQSADKYPQFNESRNVKRLLRGDDTYIIRLQRFIDENKTNSAKADDVRLAQDALDQCNAMLARTHNDRKADDAVIENARQVLIKLGLEEPDRDETPSKWEAFVEKALKTLNDKTYAVFGAKGFIDKFVH